VRHFLDTGRPIGVHADVSAALRDLVRSYEWPGNVRELRNVIERMRLLHSDKLAYDLEDLDLKFQTTGKAAMAPAASSETTQAPVPPPPPAVTAAVGGPAPGWAPTGAVPAQPADIGTFLRHGRSPMRRQERLRELFVEHKRLTRSEIIQILQVSPNTATKDLKTLVAEGSIRRVEPSASSRSFYFELADRNEPEGAE